MYPLVTQTQTASPASYLIIIKLHSSQGKAGILVSVWCATVGASDTTAVRRKRERMTNYKHMQFK